MESEIRTENSFLFYRSFYEAICDLPDEQQLKLFHAICEYGLYEKENSQLPGMANTVWKLIVPNLRASRIKRLNGRKGGRPCKEEKPEVKERNNHRFSNNETTGVDIVKSNKEREKDKDICSCSRSERADTLFSRFWNAYPRKTGKKDAQKAWTRIRPDEDLADQMIAAIEEQKKGEQWSRDGGRFVPYPATWLNGRRWEDEFEPLPKKQSFYDELPLEGFVYESAR